MMVLLQPADYQPRLAMEYEIWAARVRSLGPVHVEHIGASSIPGALSKGDLDILAVVRKEDFERLQAALTDLGFHEKSGNLRTPELCMMVHPDYAHIAIQLVTSNSEFHRLFAAFRDALLHDESLVREYNTVKVNASSLDDNAYRAAKERFITRVLAARR